MENNAADAKGLYVAKTECVLKSNIFLSGAYERTTEGFANYVEALIVL